MKVSIMRKFTAVKKIKNHSLTLFCTAFLGVSNLFINVLSISPVFAQQTEVALTVNGNAITNYDIQRRIAFLKLQQKKENLSVQAKNELIDEMLKKIEIKQRNIDVSDSEVDAAFENFAVQNHMTINQLSEMLTQTNVTVKHFKDYIRGQIGWGRLVNARYQAEGGLLTEQEVAHKILKNGGQKPSTDEYTLQRIIFVIPAHRRSEILQKRTQEANSFREHFNGCNNTRAQVKGILDVTIRSSVKILEPQLPQDWKKFILETPAGKMTQVQETPNGIEAFAVCQIKRVSDDRVAQLLFSIQHSQEDIPQELETLSEKYLKELQQAAHIKDS
ncbi:hypothetical protein H705_00466 [Bartonella bacilliformis Cond044]|nr:hypothetical protein H705_00466 [Bartonella bacilliformis Cond044]